MLVILVSLGTWQLRRLASKESLLARIDAAEQAPGVPLAAAPASFTKVHVEGRLRGDLAVLYGAEGREQRGATVLGAHLLTPLMRDGAPSVLVDRGWVDAAHVPPAPDGPAAIDGYIREADRPGWFSPAADVAARRFYTLDPAAIGSAIGLPAMAPYVLVALGPPGIPDPARALPRPPNDHLGYALTWFGFAATLLVIFALYARKVFRP